MSGCHRSAANLTKVIVYVSTNDTPFLDFDALIVSSKRG